MNPINTIQNLLQANPYNQNVQKSYLDMLSNPMYNGQFNAVMSGINGNGVSSLVGNNQQSQQVSPTQLYMNSGNFDPNHLTDQEKSTLAQQQNGNQQPQNNTYDSSFINNIPLIGGLLNVSGRLSSGATSGISSLLADAAGGVNKLIDPNAKFNFSNPLTSLMQGLQDPNQAKQLGSQYEDVTGTQIDPTLKGALDFGSGILLDPSLYIGGAGLLGKAGELANGVAKGVTGIDALGMAKGLGGKIGTTLDNLGSKTGNIVEDANLLKTADNTLPDVLKATNVGDITGSKIGGVPDTYIPTQEDIQKAIQNNGAVLGARDWKGNFNNQMYQYNKLGQLGINSTGTELQNLGQKAVKILGELKNDIVDNYHAAGHQIDVRTIQDSIANNLNNVIDPTGRTNVEGIINNINDQLDKVSTKTNLVSSVPTAFEQGVPKIKTPALKQQAKIAGMTDEEINNMKPSDLWQKINGKGLQTAGLSSGVSNTLSVKQISQLRDKFRSLADQEYGKNTSSMLGDAYNGISKDLSDYLDAGSGRSLVPNLQLNEQQIQGVLKSLGMSEQSNPGMYIALKNVKSISDVNSLMQPFMFAEKAGGIAAKNGLIQATKNAGKQELLNATDESGNTVQINPFDIFSPGKVAKQVFPSINIPDMAQGAQSVGNKIGSAAGSIYRGAKQAYQNSLIGKGANTGVGKLINKNRGFIAGQLDRGLSVPELLSSNQQDNSNPSIGQSNVTSQDISNLIGANRTKHAQILMGLGGTAQAKEIADAQAPLLNSTDSAALRGAQSALRSVDALEQAYNNISGTGPGMGNVNELLGNIGLNNNMKKYNDMRQALLSQLGRAFGEKGNLSNQDVQRVSNLLPSPSDTKEVAAYKINALKGFISDNVNNILAQYNVGQ